MSTTESEVIEECDENEAVLDPSFKINSWDELEINSKLSKFVIIIKFYVLCIH